MKQSTKMNLYIFAFMVIWTVFYPLAYHFWDYCPECGAKMSGEKNG